MIGPFTTPLVLLEQALKIVSIFAQADLISDLEMVECLLVSSELRLKTNLVTVCLSSSIEKGAFQNLVTDGILLFWMSGYCFLNHLCTRVALPSLPYYRIISDFWAAPLGQQLSEIKSFHRLKHKWTITGGFSEIWCNFFKFKFFNVIFLVETSLGYLGTSPGPIEMVS